MLDMVPFTSFRVTMVTHRETWLESGGSSEVPNRGDTVGQVEQEVVRGEEVDVEIGQSGDQVSAAPVDPGSTWRHGHPPGSADLCDATVAYQHGPMRQDALAVERDQSDVGDGGRGEPARPRLPARG